MFEKCSVRSNRSLLGNVECAATREREREMRWMAGNTRPELSSNAAAAAVAGDVMNVWPGKENPREKGRKANPADQKATATTSTIEKKDHKKREEERG